MSIAGLVPQYGKWLSSPPDPDHFLSYHEINSLIDDWGRAGATIIDLGLSSQGRPIRATSIGSGDKTLLAWGYPHPDEPLGAEALAWLGNALLSRHINLDGWQVVLILCPDPDQVARQRWLDGPLTATNFVRGCWRPEHLGREVDYGFPLDYKEFYWPAGTAGARRPDQGGADTEDSRPFAPLSESLALARAIDQFKPELTLSMHSTHSGGDYTFLLQEEDRRILEAMTQVPSACGLWRHLGEPIDQGQLWLQDYPDLIREQSLEWFRQNLTSDPEYDDGFTYGGNHSAAAYLESIAPGAQFICPESTLFRSPKFASTAAVNQTTLWQESEDGGAIVQSTLINGQWVEVHRFHADRPVDRRQFRGPMTRGALGVGAIIQRRAVISEVRDIWRELIASEGKIDDPYFYEYQQLLAREQDNRDLRKFTLSEQYREVATEAEAASFAGVWPIHTAALFGGLTGLLEATPGVKAQQLANRLAEIQQKTIAGIPSEMKQAGAIGPAIQSMIARVLIASLSDRYSSVA